MGCAASGVQVSTSHLPNNAPVTANTAGEGIDHTSKGPEVKAPAGANSSTTCSDSGGGGEDAEITVNPNRRPSLTGGPMGATGISATEDAKRRRLSIAVSTSGAARLIAEENAETARQAVVDPNNDPNLPTILVAKARQLPLQWAEYSRPGTDPMKRAKENQDSCVVHDSFGGDHNTMFFGVFDGHGPNGHHASQFVKERLPQSWLAAGNELKADPFVAMNRGCIGTNAELADSDIDVYVSGSTGISSLLRNNRLFVANVGDSRAVLGRAVLANPPAQGSMTLASPGRGTTSKGGSGSSAVFSSSSGASPSTAPPTIIRALDLSSDQKPDRPDELARICNYGGRVFEWGVPRVWLADVDMPGLAMSRSFGDVAAESVGVFAEPELSEVTLGPADKLLIWATDGVWEFISSQEAVDIVKEHLHSTPLLAAAALVKEAVKRWNEEEEVVDDTTAVVAFLNYA